MPAPSDQPPALDLQKTQRRRKQVLTLGIGLCLVLMMVTRSSWRDSAPGLYTLIEKIGLVLILVGILGRTWCTLYIGGHKKRELVTKGPYSLVRNPLYTFTLVGTLGIGAQSGSFLIALLLAASALAVFSAVVREEERFLASTFPDAFAAYAAKVPRFLPRFSLWQDADELLVKPQLVRRTFLDASLFLLAVPLMDLLDWAHEGGWLPVLFNLP